MKSQIVNAQSGHTLFVQPVTFDQLPEMVKKFTCIEDCTGYRIVRNWDKDGVIFFYIAKNHGEYLVWYRNGGLWSSYGKTIEGAINGAQKDGWMYA